MINNTTEDKTLESVIEEPEKKEPIGLFTWLCVAWLALNVVVALFAPLLPLQDPNALASEPGLGMSFHHLMGTDDLGRDIFGRLAWGTRISLGVGIGSMAIAFGVGGPLGMLAAYRRGRLDTIFSSAMFTLLAFPSIIAIIAVLSFWTPRSLSKIILVIGISSIPLVYRVMRAATLAVGSRDFVTAAKCKGQKTDGSSFESCFLTLHPPDCHFFSLVSPL